MEGLGEPRSRDFTPAENSCTFSVGKCSDDVSDRPYSLEPLTFWLRGEGGGGWGPEEGVVYSFCFRLC